MPDKKKVNLSVGRGEKRSVKQGAGLTAKGRAKYNRATGSKLKAPVTGKVKAGSKAAKRRKSFCARSKGWTGERGKAARARWKCQTKQQEIRQPVKSGGLITPTRYAARITKIDTALHQMITMPC